MSKLNESFRPVRIMDLDVWEIVFCKLLGKPVERAENLAYTGSAPVSLDLLQIEKLCKKDISLMPYRMRKPSGGTSTLRFCDAIVNVSFTPLQAVNMRIINRIGAPPKARFSDPEMKEEYKKFVLYYWVNRLNRGLEIPDAKVKRQAEKKRSEILLQAEKAEAEKRSPEELEKDIRRITLRELQDSFRSLVKSYVWGKEKDYPLRENMTRSALKARFLLYMEGFDVRRKEDVTHYVPYKRSASKAKNGDCVFICGPLLRPMTDWTWLGLSIEKDRTYEITSLKAYEALVMSSIIGTVKIDPRSILLIDSVKSPDIGGNRMILHEDTEKKGILLLSEEDEYEEKTGKAFAHQNTIWDGQALADESLFPNDHGMMLLRNSFFKACAFRARIRQYFLDHPEIEYCTDVFGRKMKASSVRLIVTVDSLKLLKFADDFFPDTKGSEARRKKLYLHWLRTIDQEFGIVKHESRSRLGNGRYHKVSYQVLNTLPLTADDMCAVTKEDRRYIDLLRNDPSVLLYHLRYVDSSVRKKYFIYNMSKYSSAFRKTKEFRTFLNQEVNILRNRMREGRVNIEGDFFVLCSMPLEMLEYAAYSGQKEIRPYLDSGSAYIRGRKENEEVALFRYPHMNSGSVVLLTTRSCEAYDRYLDLSSSDGSNIVAVSPWTSNIMAKLGGADFDSDTVLLTRDETIREAAGRLLKMKWLHAKEDGAPVAQVDESVKGEAFRDYPDEEGLAYLDYALSESGVGVGMLSNTAQLFNSILWDRYFSKRKNQGSFLWELYQCVLVLSALNELEIDKSKHSVKINMAGYLEAILDREFNGERLVETDENGNIYVPCFLYDLFKKRASFRSAVKRKRILRPGKEKYWNCPVDAIHVVLRQQKRAAGQTPDVELLSLFDLDTDEKPDGSRTISKIRGKISETLEDLKSVDADEKMTDDEKTADRDNIMEMFYSDCPKKIKTATMKLLIRNAFEKYKENGKDGKHKKGDFRYPQFAKGENRYRYLGILFAWGERLARENHGEDPAIECIRGKEKEAPVPELRCDPSFPASHPDAVVLWGQTYVKSPDPNR